MSKMLSIMIPVAPNSESRLRSLLSRINLAHSMTPEHKFEVIVCDGGSTDDVKSLCTFMSQFISLKYIYVPIYKHIDPSYPINIMTRTSKGDYLCYMSVNYWPNEYFLNVINSLEESSKAITFGRLYKNSLIDPHQEKLPKQLLHEGNTGCKFADVLKEMQMSFKPFCESMWATHREVVLDVEGFYRNMNKDIESIIENSENLEVVGCKTFEAIHINHEDKEKATVEPVVGRQGKLADYSFSIINGVTREPEEHETWIRDNVTDVENYVLDPVGEI